MNFRAFIEYDDDDGFKYTYFPYVNFNNNMHKVLINKCCQLIVQ